MWLALDTARRRGSIAVGPLGTRARAPIVLPPRRHAVGLIDAIARALGSVGARLDDLEGVVLGDGPGSFTGLRIGAAAAKALVHTRGIELRVSPSLLAAARETSDHEGVVLAVTDALRGDLYAGLWRLGRDRVETVYPPVACRPQRITTWSPRPTFVVGDGPPDALAALSAWAGVAVVPATPGGAAALLHLAGLPGGARVVGVEEVAGWEPDYGRPAEAQAKWERVHGRPLVHPPGSDR